VSAAVQDVHHRHGQHVCVDPADVAVEREVYICSGSLGCSKRYTQDRVGAQTALVLCAVNLNDEAVDAQLVCYVHPDQLWPQLLVDVIDSLHHALAVIALGISVAQLHGLMDAGRRTRGYSRDPYGAQFRRDLHFDSRIAPRIQNLSSSDTDYRRHVNSSYLY